MPWRPGAARRRRRARRGLPVAPLPRRVHGPRRVLHGAQGALRQAASRRVHRPDDRRRHLRIAFEIIVSLSGVSLRGRRQEAGGRRDARVLRVCAPRDRIVLHGGALLPGPREGRVTVCRERRADSLAAPHAGCVLGAGIRRPQASRGRRSPVARVAI